MFVMLISKNRHLIALSKRTRNKDFVMFIDFAPNLRGKPNNSTHEHTLFLFSLLPSLAFAPYFFLLIKKLKVPEGYWFVIKSLAHSFVMIVIPGVQSSLSINPCLSLVSWFWGKLCCKYLETLLMKMFMKTLQIDWNTQLHQASLWLLYSKKSSLPHGTLHTCPLSQPWREPKLSFPILSPLITE